MAPIRCSNPSFKFVGFMGALFVALFVDTKLTVIDLLTFIAGVKPTEERDLLKGMKLENCETAFVELIKMSEVMCRKTAQC